MQLKKQNPYLLNKIHSAHIYLGDEIILTCKYYAFTYKKLLFLLKNWNYRNIECWNRISKLKKKFFLTIFYTYFINLFNYKSCLYNVFIMPIFYDLMIFINYLYKNQFFAFYSKTMWITGFLTLENLFLHIILHIIVVLKFKKNFGPVKITTGDDHHRWWSPPVRFSKIQL